MKFPDDKPASGSGSGKGGKDTPPTLPAPTTPPSKVAAGVELLQRAVGKKPEAKRVSNDDFKGSNVQWEVFKDCITEPLTILPIAGSAGVGIFSVVAFSVAVTPVGAAIAAGLFFVGGSTFVWNYVVNGEKRAVDRVNMLMELRRQQFIADLDQLASNCASVGFTDGLERARQIQETYGHLQEYMKANPQGTLNTFRSLAEDTFKQGLGTLTVALNLFKAIKTIDRAKLTRELAAFRSQLQTDSSRAASLGASIEDREQRLKRLDEKQKLLDELLAKVTQIEAALQTLQLELVELGNEDPSHLLTKDGGAVQRLNETVEAARKVEARLRGTDTEDDAKERMYTREAEDAGR